MIHPPEMKLHLPMQVGGGQKATTTLVWQILQAAYSGDMDEVKALAATCAGLLYAQYNYAPPIHFAVRGGHTELVRYLLAQGAHDPTYNFYPFQESLQTVALDRGYDPIAKILDEYAAAGHVKFTGDNGAIDYGRTALQKEFEQAVDRNELEKAKSILSEHPEYALDNTYFWSEGILTMPVKDGNFAMAELLMSYGATVPNLLKWAQFYYFETYANAQFIMDHGMSANTQSWQHVTLLHDMAQKGYIDKAKLLLRHGAEVNVIDEAYRSTPLGMAARWGHTDMVRLLLDNGADKTLAGADWAHPLAWAQSKGHKDIKKLLQ